MLRLTELEVATRQTNALRTRIKQAALPVIKDLDTFHFTAIASLNKQQVLELTRSPWIDQHYNACLVGNNGTGKTHIAIALGLAACRQHKRVRFFTAAALATQLTAAAESAPSRQPDLIKKENAREGARDRRRRHARQTCHFIDAHHARSPSIRRMPRGRAQLAEVIQTAVSTGRVESSGEPLPR